MTPRLFICIPCHDRKAVLQACLPSMLASKYAGDTVRCYNDGSSEYNADWLLAQGADWAQNCVRIGVDAQRQMHIRDFREATDYTHLYFSDSDMLMDPHWRERLLEIHARTGALTCGYNTQTHEDYVKNTFKLEGDIVWRRFAPGCSYLLSREQVEKIAAVMPEKVNFDWFIPGVLGYRCAISDVSCCDHIGFAGLHDEHQKPGHVSQERALNPTSWLVEKRKEVLASLGLKESP
jgi:hypothetical protein